MTRVPALPFRVAVVKKRVNGHAQQDEQHTFATLAGAMEYRNKALQRPNTYRVLTFLVIDETAPGVDQKEPDRQIRSQRNGETIG